VSNFDIRASLAQRFEHRRRVGRQQRLLTAPAAPPFGTAFSKMSMGDILPRALERSPKRGRPDQDDLVGP
jgi:hypothetical protein